MADEVRGIRTGLKPEVWSGVGIDPPSSNFNISCWKVNHTTIKRPQRDTKGPQRHAKQPQKDEKQDINTNTNDAAALFIVACISLSLGISVQEPVA